MGGWLFWACTANDSDAIQPLLRAASRYTRGGGGGGDSVDVGDVKYISRNLLVIVSLMVEFFLLLGDYLTP